MNRPRYSAGSRRQEKQSRENRRGYLIIGLCFVAMAVIGFAMFRASGAVKLDPKTGCPITHTAPIAHTVILMDETDRLSRDDLAYAKSVIMNEYTWLPIGGRLTVRNIVPDLDQAEDIIVCRMDDGSGDTGITSNRRKLRMDFDHIAGTRLEQLFTALRVATPQKSSPILEYISAIANKPNFGASVQNRRLVIVSDMLQHSVLFSQYGRRARLPLGPEAEALARDMHGIHVRIHYIQRPAFARLQTARHRAFWRSYLQGMGADVALGHSLTIGEDPNREVWNDESE